jgi:hypothetical protein
MPGSIAAGAQAGAAFGPWGSAIGGALGAASDIASAAAGGPFMGGHSSATYGDIETDHSGWTVNIGSGSASTNNAQTKTKRKEQQQTADRFADGIGYGSGPILGAGDTFATQAGLPPYAALMLGGAVLLIVIKRLRK